MNILSSQIPARSRPVFIQHCLIHFTFQAPSCRYLCHWLFHSAVIENMTEKGLFSLIVFFSVLCAFPIRVFKRWCYTRRFATTIVSATQRCNIVVTLFRIVTTLGSLSSDVFERRTSTGNGLFAHLSRDFEQIFGQIVSIRIKTLGNINTVA